MSGTGASVAVTPPCAEHPRPQHEVCWTCYSHAVTTYQAAVQSGEGSS